MSTSINRNPNSKKDPLHDRKVLTHKGIDFWTSLSGEREDIEGITKLDPYKIIGIRLYILNDKIIGFHFLSQHGSQRKVTECLLSS